MSKSIFLENLKDEDFSIKSRAQLFLKVLNRSQINKVLLQNLSFKGIPITCRGLKSIVWKILLNYLPLEPAAWFKHCSKNFETYSSYSKDYISEPTLIEFAPEESGLHLTSDHPLSIHPSSRWNIFFKDQDLREEIAKDVTRTRTDSTFMLDNANQLKNKEPHSNIFSRILFIYGKLNQGLKYVQGMNEILAVLYYCFYNDLTPTTIDYFESDLFFCFSNLMSEIRDSYIRQMDSSEDGIKGRVYKLSLILQRVDFKLYSHLLKNKVEFEFFALKWQMLLLSQDLKMTSAIRLWDTVLADNNRFTFFYYVCIALIVNARSEILNMEFADIMQILPNLPSRYKIYDIIKKAVELISNDMKTEIYKGEQFEY